ncbi:MAG: hypothetical protein JXB32_07645 [Deltaproteobacteria bacterium]|nr:hypothetical protein [Deltaproteobacteria bacterium]
MLRAAAGPAAALGLGAACNGGVNLTGTGHDATDVPPDVAVEDGADDVDLCTDYMHTTPAAVGACYVRYLTEAEGRAAIEAAVEETTATPTDPCESPTLHERLATDRTLSLPATDGAGGVTATVDLFAPALPAAEETPPCPARARPAVGFEFLTDEAGDDEDVSDDAAGLTDAEEASLRTRRERHEAGIAVLRTRDYPYRFLELVGGGTDDYDRLRAEEDLRAAVRALIDDLRRDGML